MTEIENDIQISLYLFIILVINYGSIICNSDIENENISQSVVDLLGLIIFSMLAQKEMCR